MARFNTPQGSSPNIFTKRYDRFSGVDFSTDSSQIDDNRSPIAVNIVSDAGGYPQKRVGWRTLTQFDEKINGIYYLDGEIIVHSGGAFYRMTDENAEHEILLDGINDAKSFGIVFVGKLWILTGKEYLCYPHEAEDEEGNKIKKMVSHLFYYSVK